MLPATPGGHTNCYNRSLLLHRSREHRQCKVSRTLLPPLMLDLTLYRLAGLEKELGLKGYDYNIVLTTFYISYIAFELPSNMACKWIGPGWFIRGLTLAFGIVSLGTAFVHTMSEMCAVRFILGIVSEFGFQAHLCFGC